METINKFTSLKQNMVDSAVAQSIDKGITKRLLEKYKSKDKKVKSKCSILTVKRG